jgi:hypothetical protein
VAPQSCHLPLREVKQGVWITQALLQPGLAMIPSRNAHAGRIGGFLRFSPGRKAPSTAQTVAI